MNSKKLTPRQKLLECVADRIAQNNYDAWRIAQNDPTEETLADIQRYGMSFTVTPITINDLYSTGLGKNTIHDVIEGQVKQINDSAIMNYYLNQTDRAFERFAREAFKKATIRMNHMKNVYYVERLKPRDEDERHVMETISRERYEEEEGYCYPADAMELSHDEQFVSVYRYRVDSDLAGYYQYDESLSADAVLRLLNRGVLRIDRIDTGVFGNMPPRKMIERTNKHNIYINTDERYGDAYPVTIADYRELNPDGDFEERYDGIYEDGQQIAELQES